MGRRPPNPGGASKNLRPEPKDCLDILQAVHHLRSAEHGLQGIGLETRLKERQYVREVLPYVKDFTIALYKFLKSHKGITVLCLGELDVTFEFFRASFESRLIVAIGRFP
jgi:hypothetical protein